MEYRNAAPRGLRNKVRYYRWRAEHIWTLAVLVVCAACSLFLGAINSILWRRKGKNGQID